MDTDIDRVRCRHDRHLYLGDCGARRSRFGRPDSRCAGRRRDGPRQLGLPGASLIFDDAQVRIRNLGSLGSRHDRHLRCRASLNSSGPRSPRGIHVAFITNRACRPRANTADGLPQNEDTLINLEGRRHRRGVNDAVPQGRTAARTVQFVTDGVRTTRWRMVIRQDVAPGVCSARSRDCDAVWRSAR